MIDPTLLYLITILHTLVVLFVIITPFVGNNYFLILHSITVPFILAHWIMNNNTCCLTEMESQIRLKMYGTIPDPNDCFTYNLISPIYDFKKNNQDMGELIYIVTIFLWAISVFNLYKNWKEGRLSKLQDLIRY